jgi:Protein of unknown function (DUF642)
MTSIKPIQHATFFGACLLLAFSPMVTANAQNLVANPGFENPTLAPGTLLTVTTGNTLGAWTVVGPSTLLAETTYAEAVNGILAFNAQEGNNALDMTGAGNVGTAAGVTQSVPTMIGTLYNVSFYVGRADGNSFYASPATVDLSIASGARVSYTNSDATPGNVNWKQFFTSFTATSTSTSITFFNNTPSANNYAGLDNVSVTSSVTAPEPSTLILLVLGVLSPVLTKVHRRVAI